MYYLANTQAVISIDPPTTAPTPAPIVEPTGPPTDPSAAPAEIEDPNTFTGLTMSAFIDTPP